MLLPFCLMHMGFAGAGAVDQMFGNQLRLELVPVLTVTRNFDFTLWNITKPWGLKFEISEGDSGPW